MRELPVLRLHGLHVSEQGQVLPSRPSRRCRTLPVDVASGRTLGMVWRLRTPPDPPAPAGPGMSETPKRDPNGPKIPCPKCQSLHSRVVDSRYSEQGQRRRRECECGYRYSTIEVVDQDSLKSA